MATIVLLLLFFMIRVGAADPQINLLNSGCSQYNVTNFANFLANQNDTFADLRSQLLNGTGKWFATAQRSRSSDPVHAMIQCRNYMSMSDCVECYDASVIQIRKCGAANGARVVYDGCIIRYESNLFYDQTTLPGNFGVCDNRTASSVTDFGTAVDSLLSDLQAATPRINGYFAAAEREVNGDSATKIYAISQCAETISPSGCQDCLKVAYGNIQACPPAIGARAVDAGCFLRYSNTAFFADNQTIDIKPFLPSTGRGSSKKAIIIGGVVGGGGGLLLLLLIVGFIWYRLSRKTEQPRRGNILGATELQGPVSFGYKDLKTATDGFSEKNKLGEGGFGDVYKGTLKNGNIVAVKRLALSSARAKADFEIEVKLISNVHHRNLVRLLGCSNKEPELLLVYEYMENGSLDKFLYGDKKGTLNWKQRFNIIFGMARGLAYLHDQYHVCIIHRDIKSSNILLDSDFQTKIADFGLVRLLPEDQTHIHTRFAGTLGYTAPEYAVHGQLSEKVDTYSFGVVVLEIVSGCRSSDMTVEPVTEYLLERAWKMYEENMHIKLVDESLDMNELKEEEVKKIIEIALMCTQSPVSMRPTMSEVVLLLSERSVEFKKPSRPTFIESERRLRGDTSISSGSTNTAATASFTEFTGR
ncbi:cold-responsive protein kinase 1-like [Impatiens glandulifera]|uniref:cold-responsive protein kinase 1-like n=1 Tax=Impatiens glandulifera TaxID=253017 RepID=UPI001FB14905|nr:cold-responsive protein kinase 1-like [Impatiens glandulifera]